MRNSEFRDPSKGCLDEVVLYYWGRHWSPAVARNYRRGFEVYRLRVWGFEGSGVSEGPLEGAVTENAT